MEFMQNQLKFPIAATITQYSQRFSAGYFDYLLTWLKCIVVALLFTIAENTSKIHSHEITVYGTVHC